ncbi:hypothetical protein FRC09_005675 [Ceratobasidium sp. 395]|nr:hypothetical protein FRC09_005675 [Ceratobasidium sp. 395]
MLSESSPPPVEHLGEDSSHASEDPAVEEETKFKPLDGSDSSWLQTKAPMALITDDELHGHSLKVVKYLKDNNVDFGKFVWAVNYGNTKSRIGMEMRQARTQFRGEYLIPTLHNLRTPPRTQSKGDMPPNAKEKLDQYYLAMAGRRLRNKMKELTGDMSNTKPKSFSEKEFLNSVSNSSIQAKVHMLCPTLFMLLYMLSTCTFRNHQWENTGKSADFFIVYYFKAKHVPKAVVDLLSEMNLCMSYSSTAKTLGLLAQSMRRAMQAAVRALPFLVVHDNLHIKRAVRSQRQDSQTVTDNGTAMTVIILPEDSRSAWEDPEAARELQAQLDRMRLEETPLTLTLDDLTSTEKQAHIQQHKLFHLLDILRAIPGFKKLKILSDESLQRPPGWHDLTADPDTTTRQYMLGTCSIDESSYSANIMVIQEVMRQLKLDSGDALVDLALRRKVPWEGDEMTVSRLRMLQWQHQEDDNAYDRLDPFIFLFGWFHVLMVLIASIFENHWGSTAGVKFSHKAEVLGRTEFSENMREKQPDYHTVKEILMHEFESRVRSYWLWATGTNLLEELESWLKVPSRSAEDILAVAKRIQLERVSKQAVSRYEAECMLSGVAPDEVFHDSLIMTQDLELFWDVKHAIKHGKVEHMEDMLSERLVFFAGGRNTNYAWQMYETLQILHHESTPAIRYAIRENCWLVNMSGRKNGFYPIDLRQEFNNGTIKEYGPPPPGKAAWEDYEKASILIPMYDDIVKHDVEASVTGISRSHIHKDPAWEKDLKTLVNDHKTTGALVSTPGNSAATPSDLAKDYIKLGTTALQDKQ